MAQTSRRTHAGKPDYFLMASFFVLLVFGISMLASASSDLGKSQFNNSYYYLEHQLLYGFTIGAVGFALGYFMLLVGFSRAEYLARCYFVFILTIC